MTAADKIAEARPPQMWAACEWCVEHRNEEAVTLPDEIRWDGQKWSCEDCWDPEDDGWDRALKASDLADAQAQENARLREALDPNHTKADYIGEFKQRVCFGSDDDGNEIWEDVTISWTVTKQIMAAIRARAALGEAP